MISWPPRLGTSGNDNNQFVFMAIRHKPPHASHLWGINALILTKQEAATYFRCTPRYLERQIRAGRLKALKPTGKLGWPCS